MAETFPLYRYEIDRAGEAPETRWSFAPVKPAGYAGNDEPTDAHPMGNEPADVGDPAPAGHVEAPAGTSIASMEPPILDVPGRGPVSVLPLLGDSESEGTPGDLARLLRVRRA